MSEIEELWIGATNSETFKRVNNAITEEVFFCDNCGTKTTCKVGPCDSCIVCGYKECEE